jgi:hypothetical protein
MQTTFEERILLLRDAAQPLVKAAKNVRQAPEEEAQLLEARLFAGQVPPDLLEEFRSIADFDAISLSGEQLAYVTRIGYELKQYGLGATDS